MADTHTPKSGLASKALQGTGPVAQWITRLPTEQKILGSTPSWLVVSSFEEATLRNSLILSFFALRAAPESPRLAYNKNNVKLGLHMTDDRREFCARHRVIPIGP